MKPYNNRTGRKTQRKPSFCRRKNDCLPCKPNKSRSRRRLRQTGGVRFKPTTKTELRGAIKKYIRQENHDYGHIRTWDVTLVTDFSNMFVSSYGENDMYDGIQDWDVSHVTDMSSMFNGCDEFNQPLDAWNTSNVTNMMGMFNGCDEFNQPLDAWNTSNVTNMMGMFGSCESFNQPLNAWDVSQVTNMSRMFGRCKLFNKPLNNWNTSNVTNMVGMFNECKSFNQPLDAWNVTNVTNMYDMFNECKLFNQPLNTWNVSQVTNMSHMFMKCESFNQPLNNWNVSNVTNMARMFMQCVSFNQPLNTWNVINVRDMNLMFNECESFNQPLDAWNVSNVTNMYEMFSVCESFNQPLNTWNVSRVENMIGMFADCVSFNQPLTNWNINAQADFGTIFENCPISEENKPTRIREQPQPLYVPFAGIAYQVHNEFNTINKQELLSLLSDVATRDFSSMNNPNFVNYVKQRLQEAITSAFTAEERPPLLTALNALYTNLQMTETSQILTAEYRNLYGKSMDFMLEQPPEVVKEYLHAYVQECAMAYGTNLDVTQMDPNNMSCVKGRFERLVMCMKTALLVQCIENPNAPTCLAIYKSILKKGFGVNISDSASAVVALDKNELIQQWNSEHLENEEYKTANHVGDMTEEQRRDFFINDFIQFMRSAYEQNESLTAAIQSMIEQETNQLDAAGVFRNMMFGGRGRGRRSKGRSRRHKTRKHIRRWARNTSRRRRYRRG